MNYKINNMKFIKVEEAKRLTAKCLQELTEESLENVLESINDEILSSSAEGYDELVCELEEARLAPYVVTFLKKQGYTASYSPEDEDVTIAWKHETTT